MKFQVPKSKSQTNLKSQMPKEGRHFWILELVWNLEFGICCLRFTLRRCPAVDALHARRPLQTGQVPSLRLQAFFKRLPAVPLQIVLFSPRDEQGLEH